MTASQLAIRLRVPICIALVLGGWQVIFALGVVREKYFPSIPTIAAAFWQMLTDGAVISAWATTFLRALIGLVGAAVLGIALAILSDLSPVLSRGIRYVSDVLQPTRRRPSCRWPCSCWALAPSSMPLSSSLSPSGRPI